MRIDNFSNISHATLMQIAPKVEKLANLNLRDLPHPDINRPLTEAELALNEIRLALSAYAPQERHNPRGTMMAPIPEISAMRRARHEAGLLAGAAPGENVGMWMFDLETRQLQTFNSVAEFRNAIFQAQRDDEQNMVNRLMEAINALRATNPQPPANADGLNITI